MTRAQPRLIVLAGPNGAGKTTVSQQLLRGALAVEEFVNADAVAAGLSSFHPEREAMAAGRIMLTRLRQLAVERASFGFETTLASRTFAPWISALIAQDYTFTLVFLALPSASMAVERVAGRARLGGHSVPEDVVRRRFDAGLRNFFALYQPLATSWRVYDNSASPPRLLARGGLRRAQTVRDADGWLALQQHAGVR